VSATDASTGAGHDHDPAIANSRHSVLLVRCAWERDLAALDRHDVLIVAAEAPSGVSLGLYHDDEAVVGFECPDQAAFDHLATCLWSEAD